MGRIHLFEFEDQKWFPTLLRNYLTDFLQFLSNKSGMYKPIIPILVELLRKNQTDTIIDLGSGGGGGLLGLNRELTKKVPGLKVIMTDYFPNLTAFELSTKLADNFDYEAKPVDARNVPSEFKGLRTLFLSFHHFKPADAKLILQNAVEAKSGIALFEAQERSIPSIIAMLFSPITVLLTTPFIAPFKLSRIIFTYLIPIVPICVLWDGVVSSLRTYSLQEMENLIGELQGSGRYNWQLGKINSGPLKLLYLTGTSKY
ncbi:hypothetical protein SAMN04488057_11046 [Cyclobacterium lianum]|uniref:Methyltransferase domain-containing protein n=1 Tax=Cyclobacterium lianum TaxID=388280 RepID=A0A1M7PR93_9BACT|nr:hypothetical protein [Cyclobacterium lianum]SHN19866.1 hypothetical protein SAMN04488057_11046 [Cyclobacterium lianum]